MDHPAVVVEQVGRDQHLAPAVVMLLQDAVEAADGVVGQVRHGPAHVEDDYQFSKIFFHFLFRSQTGLFAVAGIPYHGKKEKRSSVI